MVLNRKVRILSIDGGGIRGIIPAQILLNIENLLKEHYGNETKIGDYFDIIAGTSTGGIITSLLLLTDGNNNLCYNANDIVKLYLEKSNLIFKNDFFHKIKTFFGLFGSIFENVSYEKLLNSYFGEKQLKDLKKPCIICSYDTEKRECILFKQHYAINNASYNFYLRDVVRATSAAPTYFRPTKIKSVVGENYTLVDGGIYANNPSMCAFIEINKIFKNSDGGNISINDIKILSIGTGDYNLTYPFKKIKKWGSLKWIRPFIDMSMSATNEVTDYQIKKLYEYNLCSDNYLRIDVDLSKKESSIDNIKKSNLNNLVSIGNNIFQINKENIKKFIEL